MNHIPTGHVDHEGDRRTLDLEDGPSIGPGWEFYLDRLVAVAAGGDVSGIDFDRDYYPAMEDYYRRLL